MIFRQLSGALAEDSCYLSSTSTSVLVVYRPTVELKR